MGLLKGIHPFLTADLLHTLRSMGHGDTLVVCDCNFPAASISGKQNTKTLRKTPIIHLTCTAPEALNAICSVLPLDYFQKEAQYYYMYLQDDDDDDDATNNNNNNNKDTTMMVIPNDAKRVWEEAKHVIETHSKEAIGLPLKRFEFYQEAADAFAIVQTMERRPYGNFLLFKGCVGPDDKDLKPEVGNIRNIRNARYI